VLRKKDCDHPSQFKFLLKLISGLTLISFWGFNINDVALSQTLQIGVVKAEENTSQWEEINTRLRGMNIDYCTLELSRFPQQLALSELNTLFFPNLKTWSYIEVKTLEDWLNQGNQVIVSGETGANSSPDVKNKLRSLLGAYWGFALTTKTTLNPVTIQQQDWLNPRPPTDQIAGGVIIPFGVNSYTAAVWNTSGSLPAIVMGDRTVFMGWKWGQDEVAPSRLDQAWLRGILHRYGTLPPPQTTTGMPCSARNSQTETILPPPQNEDTSESSQLDQTIMSNESSELNQPMIEEELPTENPEINQEVTPPEIAGLPPQRENPPENTKPSRVRTETPVTETIIDENFSPSTPPPENFNWHRELLIKGEDLRGLINRFESTFLTAQAYETEVNRELTLEDKGMNLTSHTTSNSLIEEAKTELNFVLELIDQSNYEEAEIKLLTIKNKLLENYPSDRNLAQPEIRYVWLDRGTIVKAKSEADLIPLFDQFAQAGINIIFMETLNAGYTIYPSNIAPEQNPLVKGWDPLKSAVKLAHERGIELHAWLWMFATANQRHNEILNQPQNYLGTVLSEHPEWVITDNKGNLFQPSSKKAFLDPANPEVRAYLLSILDEIVTHYNVDGIQLDYIRYPFQSVYGNDTHGYGLSSRQQFFKLTGVDPITLTFNDNLWEKWTDFRTQQIDSFVATVSQRLKEKKPNLILSAAVFPMPYYERIDKIQQNWEKWIKEDYIDLLLPMTYAENTTDLERLTKPVFRENFAGSTLILPGLKLQNQSEMMVLDQVQLVRSLPTLGYGLFAADTFNSNIYDVFFRTQGNQNLTNNREILPHRQPFLAVIQRYQRLQQEWNFWLNYGQLNIDETTLKNWKEAQIKLTNRLQTLVNEPTERNFLLTQLELGIFKSDFKIWMKEYKKVNSYQVEVWNNRLLALEELLNYGENMIK